ncbi:DUF1904 family protein [Paenibacillus sp. PL2-23]|uniref:DUF1904 family protein n=1 Tax=Paenibacillus sp. PL2-23 TaxID=2100729 RepID=UPI0030F9822A
MPHLLFRGLEADQLRTAAAPLAEELAAICGCGTDNFTMSCVHTSDVFGAGPQDPVFAFVEIGWFERGQDIRNQCAEAVTKTVLGLGVQEVEVVFQAYREDSYYINGKPVAG